MRSTLISGCFLAYGIGCIFINLLTLYIRSADSLSLFATFIVSLTIAPSFFSYVESPKWLQKKGRVSQLIKSLAYISKTNGSHLSEKDLYAPLFKGGEGYDDVKDRSVVVSIKHKNKPNPNLFHDLKQIFTNWM